MLMSSELMISPIRTSDDTDCAPSLIPPLPAICECSSIKPAVMCLPVASITLALPADKFLPTALILPPSNFQMLIMDRLMGHLLLKLL